MKRSRHGYPSPVLARLVRSNVARWLTVVLIAPMLVLGVFSRATFLAHCHGDHGVHLHPVGVLDDGRLAAAGYADDHCHDCTDLPCEVPCGIIITFDVHKQLPTRGIDVGKTLSPAAIAAFLLAPSLNLDHHVGWPGGWARGGPMNLLALSASDRLVRTSRALLI